jgi:hypothetical protein
MDMPRLWSWSISALLALVACNADDGRMQTIDAPPSNPQIDARLFQDASFVCQPIGPASAPPASPCLALTPTALRGPTPFGNLDVQLEHFGAGDCISHAQATVVWRGTCGEELVLRFPYPTSVNTTTGKRQVAQSFDNDARFEFRAPGFAASDDLSRVHVEVTTWQEGDSIHELDITVSILEDAYAVGPLRVAGTFCDWPYYVC